MKSYKKKLLCLGSLVAMLMVIFLTGCGHEHDFYEATCERAAFCRTCGFVKGTPLGHYYLTATCTEPETCQRCGKKNGKAKGHTTDMGTCVNCKEFVHRDIYVSLNKCMENIDANMDTVTSAIKYCKKKDDLYGVCMAHEEECRNIKENLKEAKKLCGTYSGLTYIRTDIEDGLSIMPNMPSSDAEYRVEEFTTGITNLEKRLTKIRNDLKEIK